MDTKSQVLHLLEHSSGGFTSGAVLAEKLGVSRNAVWKAIEALREDGHKIMAVTNNGYQLMPGGDVLSEAGITKYLKTTGVFNVQVRKSVTSTNTVLRELADSGAPEGLVLCAEGQTTGKGRQGREFYSPAKHGAYFSLLLRPGSRPGDAALITSAAAVAASQAIEEVLGASVGIKWINDLFFNGKKVCGILTEATFGVESNMVDSAILGIGINITSPEGGFPRTLESIATSIADRSAGMDNERCRVIAATLDNFWGYYQKLACKEFLDEYRTRSILIGRDVFVSQGGERKLARALEIDDNCGLVVRYRSGETVTINSGEVSALTY